MLTTAAPESWYLFSVSSTVKLTAILVHGAPTNSNIDILLYKKNVSTGIYDPVAVSQYGGANNELLGYVATSGDYLLSAYAVGTVTGGSFSFRIQTSTGYDSNEADDNFWQAKPISSIGGLTGNLDNPYDRDFHTFTIASSTVINYNLTGGNSYVANLYYSTGALAYTLSSNTIATLTLPAGTYYWEIAPSSSGQTTTPYVFSAYRDVSRIVAAFNSDEGNYRRNWGAGNYFALSNSATFIGYAYDANGAPAAGAYIKFTNEGSVVGLQTTTTVKTDATGYFSATITSPSGAGAHSYSGACLIYYYDVHNVKVQGFYGGAVVRNLDTVSITESSTIQIDYYNSQVPLNDVAYNIYTGC